MKPKLRWLTKKRIAIAALSLFLVPYLGWQTRTVIDYSARCANCLQEKTGLETYIFGIRFRHSEKLRKPWTLAPVPDRTSPVPDATKKSDYQWTSGQLSAVDPLTWEKFQGVPCNHFFKRTGFGKSPHFFGSLGIGCGSSSEGMAFRQRFQATEELFRLYSRIPEKDLGQSTNKELDQLFPADASREEVYRRSRDYEVTGVNLQKMIDILSIIETRPEWISALEFFQGGFKGTPPFITDEDFLAKRMMSEHTSVRRACAEIISHNPDLESPELLSTQLEDADEGVVKQAVSTIIFGRKFELFGKMLRKGKPDEYERKHMQSFDDADFQKLLSIDDPVVDAAVYEAIAGDQRLRMLEVVVAGLNHRDSVAAKKAVARLLEGPALGSSNDGDPKDPWEFFEAFDGSMEQAIDRVRQGYSRSSDFWSLLKSMKKLATTHDPGHWTIAKRAYEQAADDGVNEFHLAIFAKALMEIDPDNTALFLMSELKKEDHRRLVAALAGMGLIASPIFTNSIESFQNEPPSATQGNPYPPKYYFQNGEPAKILRYALHRCRGVQNWQLLRDGDGRYFIKQK